MHPPKDPRDDLDVVVPVWNEELRLGPTLGALLARAGDLPMRVCVTVVDNGSVDRTAEVVDEAAHLAPENTRVRLIGCSRQGKGAAVRRGMLASSARWRGFVDADLSTPPSLLLPVASALLAGDPVTTTIGDVARYWGFAHAGRFSAAYAEQHGEYPRDTLRRS